MSIAQEFSGATSLVDLAPKFKFLLGNIDAIYGAAQSGDMNKAFELVMIETLKTAQREKERLLTMSLIVSL